MSDGTGGGNNVCGNLEFAPSEGEIRQAIIQAEVELLNRACMLIDSPEFKEFIAARQRYDDVTSIAYGVPESIWYQPKGEASE